jgi:predicted DsbA family dithiol-disulfide isomerase
MKVSMKIDVVSDVVCPWCAVGLASLLRALDTLGDELRPTLHFQPFELNPTLGPGGQDIVEYLGRKYGSTPEQIELTHVQIAQRGAAVGFEFNLDLRTRTYNSFDAHRLLYWAGLEGEDFQLLLKLALLRSYFTEGLDPGDSALLVRLATETGLDPVRARDILSGDEYGAEVREREQFYQTQGIRSVPSFIINDRHLISGGQPPEFFVQALRQIAAEG